jgi:hypothetical protein
MAPSTPTNPAILKDTADIVTKTAEALKKLDENPEIAKEVRKYGKVPTFYGPTRSMVRPPAVPGLSYFIDQATTVKEVENLLNSGKEKYKKASAKTIRRWEKQASAKIASLSK